MATISNDFVTIEYSTEENYKVAKYYIKLFNANPEFYKGVLNGRTVIHESDLVKLINYNITNNYERMFAKTTNKERIVSSILRLEKSHDINFSEPKEESILFYISYILEHKIGSVDLWNIYYHFAYLYFKKTKDFKYLKDYWYCLANQREETYSLADYLVLNTYDELLKIKIKENKRNCWCNPFIDCIDRLIEITEEVNLKSRKALSTCKGETTVPRITDSEFEKLVMGILNYIDPTNKLLEKYEECRKEDRIKEKPYEEGKCSNCFHSRKVESILKGPGEIADYGINLYKKGDLQDVIAFIHEFGHLYHMMYEIGVERNNALLEECSSIYYERLAIEYLQTVGYSKEQVMAANKKRLLNDIYISTKCLPSMFCLSKNYNEKADTYEIESVKEYINYYADKFIDETTRKFDMFNNKLDKLTPEKKRLLARYFSLTRTDTISESIDYIIGTSFAEYAMTKLTHEDTLRILEDIQYNKRSLKEVFDMLDARAQGHEIEKAKQKQV